MSTISHTSLFNVQRVNPFMPYRGLKQGDPVFPYMFFFYALALFSRDTRRWEWEKKQLRNKICKKESFNLSSHICRHHHFIFQGHTEEVVTVTTAVLDRFSNMDGQSINKSKSFVVFSSILLINKNNNI